MSQELNKTVSPNPSTSTIWDVLKILVPSLVTALIGFFIWNAQTKIQNTVENSNQILQTQLALREEFYKRRLTIYESACKQIAETKSALDQAGATPEYETQAQTMMADLDKLRKINTLYWSPDLEKRLSKVWWLGIQKLKNIRAEDDQAEDKLANEIAQLHAQMKVDLDLGEIARLLKEAK